jgi:hypothetical protein
MSINASGFGTQVQIHAVPTFPAGFTVTNLPDDADPVDVPSTQINDKSMGLNGDLVTWSKGNPLPVTINVLPNSESDINLAILAEANRVGRGKLSANDVITLTVIKPDGSTATYINGKITDAMFGDAIASSSRLKTKPYAFAFENVITTRA